MGFFPAATEVILQEHKFRSITGRALMIGRQNTGLTPDEATQLLTRNGLPLLTDRFELDKDTQHVTGRDGEITDRSFFAAFCDCSVEAIDVSDYEGAEIVHDLSVPIPDVLKGQFDFIYDGSTLDNVFNVATAMQNINDLLKPGGRCVLMNWSNSTPTAYAMLSPDWFMDFFAYNEYEDAKVLVVETGAGEPPRIWNYDPIVVNSGQYGYQCSNILAYTQRATVCLAEKSGKPPRAGFPVQMHYRGQNTEPYLSSALRYRASKRHPYDFSHFGILTKRPNISRFDTTRLMADGDVLYDDKIPSLRKRIASAILERRVLSGIKRRVSLISRIGH
jgi:SAM-dependent methyltransferase